MKQKWYTSKGIWGGILMLVALILQVIGVADITPDDQAALTDSLVNVSTIVAEVVGLVLSIWGRITARKPIGTGSSGSTIYDLGIAVFLILMSVGYAMGFVNHHHNDKAAPADCHTSQFELPADIPEL